MSTIGQFNTKNPTIKRILKEATELASSPSSDFHAEPLDTNLFEWHFTLRGPPAPSPFATGIYHGRIVLPSTYPLRPPSFRFLTPSGRFEVNREICLSISGHHEETWQPAWGIRTALVALRSFMDTDVAGQVGGLAADEATRRALAGQSGAWRCDACGRSNEETVREKMDGLEDNPAASENKKKEEIQVPSDLRLAFREDLVPKDTKATSSATSSPTSLSQPQSRSQSRSPCQSISPTAAPTTSRATSSNQPTQIRSQGTVQHRTDGLIVRRNRETDAWLDKAITTIAAILGFLIIRRILMYIA